MDIKCTCYLLDQQWPNMMLFQEGFLSINCLQKIYQNRSTSHTKQQWQFVWDVSAWEKAWFFQSLSQIVVTICTVTATERRRKSVFRYILHSWELFENVSDRYTWEENRETKDMRSVPKMIYGFSIYWH